MSDASNQTRDLDRAAIEKAIEIDRETLGRHSDGVEGRLDEAFATVRDREVEDSQRMRMAELKVSSALGATQGPFAFSELLQSYLIASPADRDMIFIATARRLVSPGSYIDPKKPDGFNRQWAYSGRQFPPEDLAELTAMTREIIGCLDRIGRTGGV